MSADIISDKELSSLLKRLAAALENPDTDEDVPLLIEDASYAAKLLDRRRGIEE